MKICLFCARGFESDDWSCPICGKTPESIDEILLLDAESVSDDNRLLPCSFEYLFSIENKYFWFLARNELICWAFGKYFPDVSSFLEIGCGNGIVLSCLEKKFGNVVFTGSDHVIESLIFARTRLVRSGLIHMDVLRPPFQNEFDAVGLFDVLEHISDDERAIRNIFAIIKPGGQLLLTVPQHPALWSNTDDVALHKRRYSSAGLTKKLEKVGFRVCRITSFMTFLLPVIVASRLLRKYRDQSNGLNELEIPDWLNRLFGQICRSEQFLIKWGLSMPFGGSLLVVARKPN